MLLTTLSDKASTAFTSSIETLSAFLNFFQRSCWENQAECSDCESVGEFIFSLQLMFKDGTHLKASDLGDNILTFESAISTLKHWLTTLEAGVWAFEAPVSPIEEISFSTFCPCCLNTLD